MAVKRKPRDLEAAIQRGFARLRRQLAECLAHLDRIIAQADREDEAMDRTGGKAGHA